MAMSHVIDKSKSIRPFLSQRTSCRLTALRLWFFKRWLDLAMWPASLELACRKQTALARPLRPNGVLARSFQYQKVDWVIFHPNSPISDLHMASKKADTGSEDQG